MSERRALCNIFRGLEELLCHEHPHPKPRLRVTASIKGISFTCDGDFKMDIVDTLVPGTITLSINPTAVKDAKGKQAQLDGKPVWSVQDGQDNVTLVSQADDGFSATYHITDNIAATQAQVSADGRLGPEVFPLSSNFVFNVIPGDAVTLGDVAPSEITPDA